MLAVDNINLKGFFWCLFFYHGVVKKLSILASLSSSLNVHGCWWMWCLQIWSDCGIFGCLPFELLPRVTCDGYLVPLEQLLELLLPFPASTARSAVCSKNGRLVGPLVHLHLVWVEDPDIGFVCCWELTEVCSVNGSDLKCGFGRDREKLLKCENRVPYRGENAVRPTLKPFQCGRFVAVRRHFKSLVNGE